MLNAKQSEYIKEYTSLVGWDPIWAAAVEEGHMSWINIKSITVIECFSEHSADVNTTLQQSDILNM